MSVLINPRLSHLRFSGLVFHGTGLSCQPLEGQPLVHSTQHTYCPLSCGVHFQNTISFFVSASSHTKVMLTGDFFNTCSVAIDSFMSDRSHKVPCLLSVCLCVMSLQLSPLQLSNTDVCLMGCCTDHPSFELAASHISALVHSAFKFKCFQTLPPQ